MLLRLSCSSVVVHVLAHISRRSSMGFILNLGLGLNLARLGYITS